MDKNRKFLSFLGVISALVIGLTAVSCNQPARERQTPTNPSNKITVYPHPEGFIGTHGEAFLKDSKQCLRCHGADLAGGSSKVSCHMCHGTSIPHPSNWSVPSAHGAFFTQADDGAKALCVTCHTPSDTRKGITCFECHKAYPHDMTPNEGIKGGMHKEQAHSFIGKCLNCHVGYTKNMPTFPDMGCKTCHADRGEFQPRWSVPAAKATGARKPNTPAGK